MQDDSKNLLMAVKNSCHVPFKRVWPVISLLILVPQRPGKWNMKLSEEVFHCRYQLGQKIVLHWVWICGGRNDLQKSGNEKLELAPFMKVCALTSLPSRRNSIT